MPKRGAITIINREIKKLKDDTKKKEILKAYTEIKLKLLAWEILTTDLILEDIIKRMANGKFYYGHKIRKSKREILLKALEVDKPF